MSAPVDLVEADYVVNSVTGHTIMGGGLDGGYEGFHLRLDDGRVLVFTGMFVVYVHSPQDVTWQ